MKINKTMHIYLHTVVLRFCVILKLNWKLIMQHA